MNKDNEKNFHDWWKVNEIKNIKVVRHEFQLKDARKMLQREIYERVNFPDDDTISKSFNVGHAIGNIDVVFYKRNIMYVGEIKYMKLPNDFWDAMKVIGYCEYFKWQTDLKNVKPAILIPSVSIRLEHQIIANKLKIKLFGIEKIDNKYILQEMN